MFRRILVLVMISSLAVGATWAYFSATAQSSNNVVTAGTLAFGTPVNATWTAGAMVPGQTLSGNYSMDNAGTMAAEHLEIATTNTGGSGDLHEVLTVPTMQYGFDSDDDGDVSDEPDGNKVDIISVIVSGTSSLSGGSTVPATQDADYTLRLEAPYGGSTDVAQLDANNDNILTLKELSAGVIEIRAGDNNQGLAAGSKAAFYATLSLPAATGNEYQGKSNTLTWTYTLNQDATQ